MTPNPRPGLQEAIIVFNLQPAAYADPTWVDAPAPWRDRLLQLQSPAARQALSDWLLDRLGVADLFDFDFNDIEKAMFLLPPADLQALAAKVGLLRHRHVLRMMIANGVLRRLGSELGAKAVQECLVELPLPDSLPMPDAEFDENEERLAPQLVAAGAPWLLGLLKPEWYPVVMRARLKFSRELAAQPPVALTGDMRDSALSYLKTHLLKKESL